MTTPQQCYFTGTEVRSFLQFVQCHMCAGDSIMGLSVLWCMTTIRASKGNSSFGSVQL